jgi:hypothetical protein
MAALAASPLCGCSLIDGWGGLEGGDAGAGRDADLGTDTGGGSGGDASGSSSGGTDAAPATDGPGPGDTGAGAEASAPTGAACGGTRCDSASNQGCCYASGGTPSCTTAGACASPSSFFLCDDSSQCASLGAQATCCFQIGTSESAACTAGACLGEQLCSGPGGKCPAGKQCVAGAPVVPAGYSICN